MKHYVGIDVSLEASSVCVVDSNGNIVREGKVASEPDARRHSTRPWRLVERFEWHYTPKHGSRLDLAESELGVLSSQCLDRRIADKQTLIDEVAPWQQERNANHTKANWHFTTSKARVKLRRLCPSI
jgi:hypothetical protein